MSELQTYQEVVDSTVQEKAKQQICGNQSQIAEIEKLLAEVK